MVPELAISLLLVVLVVMVVATNPGAEPPERGTAKGKYRY
jgi:hypothetical protein